MREYERRILIFESIQLRDDPDLVSQQTCCESVLLVHVPLVSWERSQI